MIAANTLSDWVNNDAKSLTALYDAHCNSILNAASQYMMADEIGFRVLDQEKLTGKSHTDVKCGPMQTMRTKWCSSNTSRAEVGNMKDQC